MGPLTPRRRGADIIVDSLETIQPIGQVAWLASLGKPNQMRAQVSLQRVQLARVLEPLAAVTPNRLQAAIAPAIQRHHRFIDQPGEEVEHSLGFEAAGAW